MKNDAKLSVCRKYRYALWRTWDNNKKVMFIGLNPSTADETEDDNTIKRCISYAKQWGYGGIIMGNLFAYRATSPEEMKRSESPIGKENNDWLDRLAQDADIIVAMWGNAGSFNGRAQKVTEKFQNLMCLKITRKGQPHHTRGLPNGIKPIPYNF